MRSTRNSSSVLVVLFFCRSAATNWRTAQQRHRPASRLTGSVQKLGARPIASAAVRKPRNCGNSQAY